MINSIFQWWKSRLLKRLVLLILLVAVGLGSSFAIAANPPNQNELTIPALLTQAKAAYQTGEFQTSQQLLEQLVERFVQKGDRLNQAMALSNLSLTAQQLGKWETATSAIAESQALLQQESSHSPEKQTLLAQAFDIQGQLQLHRGQADQALQTWQQAFHLYQEMGNTQGVIDSQINQAQAYQESGLYPRACQTLLGLLEIPQTSCQIEVSQLETLSPKLSPRSQILVLRNLGNILRTAGKLEESYFVLEKSLKLANKLDSSENLAEYSLDLGNTARAIANQNLTERERNLAINLDFGKACLSDPTVGKSLKFYLQAAACYRETIQQNPHKNVQLQARLNLLSLKLQRQHWLGMKDLVEQIDEQLQTVPPNRTAIAARLKLAQNLMCLQWNLKFSGSDLLPPPILQSCLGLNLESEGSFSAWIKLKNIEQLVQTALTQSQKLGDSLLEANALGYLGAIAYLQDDLPTALQFTEKARMQVSNFNHPEIAYLWQWQLGRILQRQGQIDQAIIAYTTTYQLLQSLRQELVGANADLQFAFRDRVDPVYRELVDLLLQSDSPNLDRLAKSRDVIESLQVAELNNFFKEACLEGTPQQLDQIDSHAAIVYAITLPKRLAVILSLPTQPLQVYENPTKNPQEIEEVVQSMLKNTLNPRVKEVNLQANQQLYDWLIRPFEQTLKEHDIQTLVFVLDGVLRGVPVAALHDGQHFLLKKYALALTPGLQLLSAPSAIQRSPNATPLTALIAGLVEARQGFNALPNVAIEVQEIASLFPSTVLMNQDFNQNRLQTELKDFSFPIVHLATHAQFSSKAEDTFLLTYDDRINVKNLDQLLRETKEKPIPIELLILSACETASGDNRAPLGLAGVAVRSGAKSTLATIWPVNDQSTAQFMTQFYPALNQQGKSKAEALRQAQLSLLQDDKYHHPYFWAPFVLIGNWL
jgi:CHAT domain-containing protein